MSIFKLPLLLAALVLHWTPQDSGTTAGLRGLSVVSGKIAWASGTKGTVLRTLDGGRKWELRNPPGVEALDFRDVEAFDSSTALLMSSGTGIASRVYATTDGGANWTLVFSNPDPDGFFDAMKFWDRRHGILLGDPVAGRFSIFITSDGGQSWSRANQPGALSGEGAFAASGTCLRTFGSQDVWFGTGGPGVARIFHSPDQGRSWTAFDTPLAGSTASSGIFSLLFLDPRRGVAVGGNYQKPDEVSKTVALTSDGGHTWAAPSSLTGFRSGLTYLESQKMIVAVGSGGSSTSLDAGTTWSHLSAESLNAVDSKESQVWAVGPKGLIVKLAVPE